MGYSKILDWGYPHITTNVFQVFFDLPIHPGLIFYNAKLSIDYRTRAINHRDFYSNTTSLALKLPLKNAKNCFLT